MSEVVVSTECPNCSAPLDFSEGANAVRCLNCRSNLLVTGRKQVLSYFVAPKVTAGVAGTVARAGQLAARVVRAHLYFIPFYRLRGHDFQWQDVPQKPADDSDGFSGTDDARGADLAGLAFGRQVSDAVRAVLRAATWRRQAPEPVIRALAQQVKSGALEAQVQFVDRYVEKSFLARDLPGLDVYSLGVRAQVLRVRLLRPGALAPLGTAVEVGIDVEAATGRGLQVGDVEHVVYRQVLGRILSVIYFPFWVVELQQRGQSWLTIVDGVAESVVQSQASLSLYRVLDSAPAGNQPTVGFRPLVCPNCGWDLPVNPDDIIFFCDSCERVWQIRGTDMTEMPHEIADVKDGSQNVAAVYLPFWLLDTAPGHSPSRYYVPAFRYRRLKALADLTVRLSGKPRTYDRWTGTRPQVRGCFYDAEDAALLAHFTAAGPPRPKPDVKLSVAATTLTWFPFKRAGRELVDPFTGMALQESLLG